jgi:DNA-binding NtrC family response regulator
MSEPIKALVVDDEQIIRDIVEDILACEGSAVETTTVGCCEDALRLVGEQDFDVIFIDVCMGDGDGVELLQQIKQTKPDARIYMITGYDVGPQLQAALAAGALGAIHKPFRVGEILAAIHGMYPEPTRLSE